jgi:DNA invertase Pin-like site-specific DNA recombinase
MALLGYARVSTGDQTLHLQLDALHAAGCLDVYEEQASGAQPERPILQQLLRACREGDTLVVWRLDRLGRDLRHLVRLIDELAQRQIHLKTLTGFEVDTSTPHGKLAFHLFAALAEYERALDQERILAGIQASRARGTHMGRPWKLSPAQQQLAREMAAGGIAVRTIASTLGCGRQTIYRALAVAREKGGHSGARE